MAEICDESMNQSDPWRFKFLSQKHCHIPSATESRFLSNPQINWFIWTNTKNFYSGLMVWCNGETFLNCRTPFPLSVCLSVCNVDDTDRTVKVINTKLYTYMYLGSGYMCIVLGVDDVIDDVIRFTNRSNFEIAITPSIFELERRTKS